jgi:hypothetical protein
MIKDRYKLQATASPVVLEHITEEFLHNGDKMSGNPIFLELKIRHKSLP